ncbi:MAG TPA: D-glycero-beta-D-manno-heptose 1-phosphate adenylyltransferase [Candidatus Kapabacteria bacterium]
MLTTAPIFDLRDSSSRDKLTLWRKQMKDSGKSLVFTNGVFDILHTGHATYLLGARNLGDALIIGLNSDASVRRIKGEKRPIVAEADRAFMLTSLKSTDAVVIFDEDTPLELISFIIPDVLIKGADYLVENIVGREVVEANGGKVLTLDLVEGRSTTNVVETILNRYSEM